MPKPGVAVVILNWNGKSFLEKFLPSVIQYTPDWARVVIADNASTDDSIDFLAKHFPDLQLIQLAENLGYAGGYNAALARVEADYFVLLNSDIEVPPQWVEPVIDYLEAHPWVAAAQPKILSWYEKQSFEYAGAAGGFIDVMAYPFCRGRIFHHLEKDQGQYAEALEVFWATGACLFVRAEAFQQAGGFDAAFFAHMEEIDLCWRLQNLGYKVMSIPASRVFHLGGGTLPKSSPLKTFLNFRNSLWLLTKNMPARWYYPLLPVRLGLDVMAALSFLLGGKWADAWAVCRAHFAFFGNFRRIRSHAAHLPQKLPSGIYKGSIAFTHFIRGKKTFHEINRDRMS
ncbi:MAG: glycosyltransferase family 2 protein [Bacteroides sp.]|jgi:GT2 family glycosyltransferase|nr:glycosyltransferase family 2 protein [Bacteroides sp.]